MRKEDHRSLKGLDKALPFFMAAHRNMRARRLSVIAGRVCPPLKGTPPVSLLVPGTDVPGWGLARACGVLGAGVADADPSAALRAG